MGTDLDINEHLGLLRGLACDDQVRSIVEIGFRTGVSATALASAGKPLSCYDIEPCTSAVQKLWKLAPNFTFTQADSLKVTIPKCDLLHIDSLHTYKHLLAELRLHAIRSTRWIALHDTETFATKGKDGSQGGLVDAVERFLEESPDLFQVYLHLPNNNGMTVLKRR